MNKSVAQTILEIQKPLSQGEQNFVALHGVLQPNKNLVPGITDQDHIFNGTPRKMDPETASYENVKDKDDSDESTKVYDKTLKVEEEVESIVELSTATRSSYRSKAVPHAKSLRKLLGTINQVKTDDADVKAVVGDIKKDTKRNLNNRVTGILRSTQKEEVESVEEAKGEEEYSKRYGAGGKKRPPADEMHPNQKKLDVAEPKGKLTAADFAKLRQEEVEAVEEAKGEDEYYKRYGAGGKKRPEPKEVEKSKGEKDHDDYVSWRKANFNDKETTEKIVTKEAKGEEEYSKRYGAGGKKRPPLDPIGKEDEDVNNDGKVNKADSYLSNRRKVVAKYLNQTPVKEERSSLRLSKTMKLGSHEAKVYKNTETGEHQVKFYTDGKHHSKADYYTDDKEDAHGTATVGLKDLAKEHTKKMFKENEQIDEISRDLATRYVRAARTSTRDAYYGDDSKTMGKRKKGIDIALLKKWGDKKFGLPEPKVKATTEDIDQIEEGRPSQRHPLEGHDYHKKTNAELEYIGKDAHKAAEAMKGVNTKAENKYLDQANDAATVMYFRKKSGTPEWYKKKYGHIKENIDQIDELKKSTYQAVADEAKRRKENADAELASGSKSKTLKKFSTSYGKTMALAKKKMEKMDEKTLTPAEMKKREEIAMAIAKKNPDMPMAKKMAIATAAAKKVAENVENLEEKEFSKDSLRAAMDALAKTDAAVKSERTDMARKAVHMQRQNFLKKHIDYIKKRMYAEPTMAKEDIDAIAEEEINVNFHRAEAKRVAQKISSLKNSEKPIPDGLFAELQKHKQEIEKAEKSIKFQNEEVDFPTPAADTRGMKTRVQRNKEGVLKVIPYTLPRKEIKIGEAIDDVNMMQASVDKLKTDPLVSKVNIKLPPSQGVKSIGGDEQVHASMAEEKLNKLYETLSDENKEKFMIKLETESGVQQLIKFAERQGF